MTFRIGAFCTALTLSLALSASLRAEAPVRARDLGVPFAGQPGVHNAITDVSGVLVGLTTLIQGDATQAAPSAVRTGVTAIIPRGAASLDHPVFAGTYALNGNGEMTGTAWIEESGFLEGPIVITNTHSVGLARDTVIKWRVRQASADPTGYWWSLPVVAETYDGFLNDINGFHVTEGDVFHALDTAASGPIAEGNTGGGTGMISFEFKGGTGTSSRVIASEFGGYTVGVLVQANCGRRLQLMIAGVPVGREIVAPPLSWGDTGSIIVVVATDAPLLPNQLKRLARRASMGLARTGSVSGNSSGDLFLAFSTANEDAARPDRVVALSMLPNGLMDPLFEATVEATEEAILNALVAAQTMTGNKGHTVPAIPHDEVRRLLAKYQRLNKS